MSSQHEAAPTSSVKVAPVQSLSEDSIRAAWDGTPFSRTLQSFRSAFGAPSAAGEAQTPHAPLSARYKVDQSQTGAVGSRSFIGFEENTLAPDGASSNTFRGYRLSVEKTLVRAQPAESEGPTVAATTTLASTCGYVSRAVVRVTAVVYLAWTNGFYIERMYT